MPLAIEIEPEVRRLIAGIGVGGIEGHRGDLGTVGQGNQRTVAMHLKVLVIVIEVGALSWFIIYVPMPLALRAIQNHPCHHASGGLTHYPDGTSHQCCCGATKTAFKRRFVAGATAPRRRRAVKPGGDRVHGWRLLQMMLLADGLMRFEKSRYLSLG